MIGIDPGPHSLRELLWMARGRSQAQWHIASAQMALLANCHRDPKRKPAKPADFNFDPLDPKNHRTTDHRPLMVPVSTLKHVFVRPQPRTK